MILNGFNLDLKPLGHLPYRRWESVIGDEFLNISEDRFLFFREFVHKMNILYKCIVFKKKILNKQNLQIKMLQDKTDPAFLPERMRRR